jgi:hypothetical protein
MTSNAHMDFSHPQKQEPGTVVADRNDPASPNFSHPRYHERGAAIADGDADLSPDFSHPQRKHSRRSS